MATWTRQVEEDTRLVAIAAQAKQGQLEQECLRSEQEAEVEVLRRDWHDCPILNNAFDISILTSPS